MTAYATVALTSQSLEDMSLLMFPVLRAIEGFAHCVTTRPWNMAAHRGPDVQLAVARRKRVCEHLGLPFSNLVAADQIHSAHVLRVRPSDRGRGNTGRETAMHFVDGLVCGLPGVPVIQFSADCPIIIVVDRRHRVFGTAHASWRGTVAGIATELVRQMVGEFQVKPGELLAGISPCAGAMEYEVGEEVLRIAQTRIEDAERHFPTDNGKRYFDLRSANLAQLVQAGLRPEQIIIAAESTMSDRRFFSHRRDGPDTGRFAVIAGFRQ